MKTYTIGDYTGTQYKIELLKGAQPYHTSLFPILKVHNETLKTVFNRLVNSSEWAAPTFIIPKKYRTVCFISDFRELNKRIKRM